MPRHGVTQIKQITIPSDNRGAGRCGLRKRRATRFLTNINRTTVIATTMKINLQQEDAMGAKSKSGIVRGAGRKRASNAPGKPGRGAGNKPEAWEQTARVPDDRDDEIDCQRIVQGDGGRSLPRYFDDYN